MSESLHPMDCSMPGFSVYHQHPEFSQTHVHSVGDAIQPISSSVIPFSSNLQSFQASGSFPMSQFFTTGGQSIEVSSFSISTSKVYTGLISLGWTGRISLQSRELSRVFSNTTVKKHKFGAQLFFLFLNFYLFLFFHLFLLVGGDLLYNIVVVLSYIDMNQPWIYMCSPSRSPLPPASPSHPSGSSQCTSPEHLSHASNLGW